MRRERAAPLGADPLDQRSRASVTVAVNEFPRNPLRPGVVYFVGVYVVVVPLLVMGIMAEVPAWSIGIAAFVLLLVLAWAVISLFLDNR